MAITARKKAAPKQLTTAQRLDSIIKSARKIMRKDKGLNGDLDRLPMLTWIMFLKFLDDMERIEEGRAEMAGKDYRSIIESPYRWRDWAAQADGITGPDLLSFLVAEMTELPDGTRGPGLFAYLRALRGDDPSRPVPRPRVTLLDLNMPRMNGIEFLAEIKRDACLCRIPVVVLTTSSEEGDRIAAFSNSVAGYMVKPVDYPQFVGIMALIRDYWLTSVTPA